MTQKGRWKWRLFIWELFADLVTDNMWTTVYSLYSIISVVSLEQQSEIDVLILIIFSAACMCYHASLGSGMLRRLFLQ